MGHNPIPPYQPPSRIEVLKRMYVKGSITLEELELMVADVLERGVADEPCPISPPPKPGGLPARIQVSGELR